MLQGLILLPLLFQLYINDLKTVVPNGVEVVMFADDVSLFCNYLCKLTTRSAMQKASHTRRGVEQASQVNAEQCEVACFTTNLHAARWQPKVHLEGQPLFSALSQSS